MNVRKYRSLSEPAFNTKCLMCGEYLAISPSSLVGDWLVFLKENRGFTKEIMRINIINDNAICADEDYNRFWSSKCNLECKSCGKNTVTLIVSVDTALNFVEKVNVSSCSITFDSHTITHNFLFNTTSLFSDKPKFAATPTVLIPLVKDMTNPVKTLNKLLTLALLK